MDGHSAPAAVIAADEALGTLSGHGFLSLSGLNDGGPNGLVNEILASSGAQPSALRGHRARPRSGPRAGALGRGRCLIARAVRPAPLDQPLLQAPAPSENGCCCIQWRAISLRLQIQVWGWRCV